MSMRTLTAISTAILAATLAISAFFAGVGALAIGGGFTFRPTGAALVNRRGQPISRVRALLRAAVVWSPLLAVLVLMKYGPGVTSTDGWRLALESGLLAVLAGGAAWAIAHPSRAIQDRIAGTWIVPR
jgi:hypothetical protein